MTLLAGVYCRHAGDAVPDELCTEVQRALSRHPSERTSHFRDNRCFLVKADIGAYGDAALRIDQHGVSFLAGEPLLGQPGSTPRSRTLDLDELHMGISRDNLAALTRARGVFCAVHYRPESATLILLTDKLGLRPMYYWLGERYVIFATALRILEAVQEIPKVMDLQAVTEIYALEYPLSDRTPFASISLLKSAEILRVEGEASSRMQYWRWDDIETSDRPIDELTEVAYREFTDAVALRSGADSSTAAFLSGGLDSRAIVMALVQKGLRVHTFNFSFTGTQDQVFGADFARRVGTTHTERPREHGRQVSARFMADTWSASANGATQPAERPSLVWSGDGGSVTLGHVYLNRAMVDLAHIGNTDGALRLYAEAWAGKLPQRLLTSEMREAVSDILHRGLQQELSDLHNPDAGRALHLVLMLNDQRRHLAEHFESIDLNRLEYHLPFFDSEFVASVLKVPVEMCLGHRLYMRWLRHFPEAVLSVPWQAYPGHEPCPLPIPGDLAYQWEEAEATKVRDAKRHDLLRQATQMLNASDFPDPLFRKHYLRLAAWLYRLRMRDVGHIIGAAHMYYRYWSECGGKYSRPTPYGVG